MVAKFGDKPITLSKEKEIATLNPHLSTICDLSMTRTNIFSYQEYKEQTIKNRTPKMQDTTLIIQCLDESQKSLLNEDKTM